MTASTTTLNPGTGGDKVLNDSLTTVDGGAAPSGAVAQVVKLAFGAQSDAKLVSSTVAMPVAELVTGTHFAPGYDLAEGAAAAGPLLRDPGGNLVVRGQVLTDEGGYRVNFANTSLAVAIGTCTFTNGSSAVTGTGFLAADIRAGDYVKLNADAESAWVQVETLNSDTSLTLVSNYTGTGGNGAASRALIKPSTGTGGTISVASGVATIAAGTTAAVFSELERDVDWLPVIKQAGVAISQRIANQTTYIGFYDESAPSAPKWYAWFAADGTTNTSIRCESARNPTAAPSGNEIETTTVTLPNGATTAVSNRYRVEVLGDRVAFYINGFLVATHFKAMPGPGDLLTSTVRVLNGTTPATNTNVLVDYDTCINHNKLQVGLLSDTEQVIAAAAPLQQFSYNVAGVIAINTDLIVLDCLQLRSLFIQCTSMGTAGVVTVQWANDAAFTTPITATLLSEAGVTSTTFNAAVLRVTNVLARYCRLRLTTATTAGTTTINMWGSQSVYTPIVTTQPVSGTVTATGVVGPGASNAALSGNPVRVAGSDGTNTQNIKTSTIGAVLMVGGSVQNANVILASAARTASGNSVYTSEGASTAGMEVSVTASSGTSITLDVVIQEAYGPTQNWYDIYHAERITGNSLISIPPLTQAGGTRRVVWTIGGTTPSFTFNVQSYTAGVKTNTVQRKFYDRTAGLLSGTLNATSASFMVWGCRSVSAAITIGAATTGGTYKLQGSMNGTDFYDISSTVVAVANSTVQITSTAGIQFQFARLICSSAATGQTGTLVSIMGGE